MLNSWFQSILVNETTAAFSLGTFLACTAASLVLGIVIAVIYMYRNTYTKGFVVTLALMPAIVQMVIMLVNGNLGTGVAVMGAFSLVRFRSVPGTAREISSIFLAMAVGLATGMGVYRYCGTFCSGDRRGRYHIYSQPFWREADPGTGAAHYHSGVTGLYRGI